jgi:hypothetical protein
MEPTRADRILQEWDEVAGRARRPAAPPARVAVVGGPSLTTLAGAGVILAALLVAVMWFGQPDSNDLIGGDPSASPIVTPSPSALPTPSPSPTAAPTPTATPTQTATATPEIGPCAPGDLASRITMWEGAAGHRIAHVEMTNTGSSPCTVRSLARPQLVDGSGAVLIDGTDPAVSEVLTTDPGSVLTTLVQDGNYCGPAPVAPVSVAFVMPQGRIVATPVSPTDATLPPCLGQAGSAGTIEMQPWAQ